MKKSRGQNLCLAMKRVSEELANHPIVGLHLSIGHMFRACDGNNKENMSAFLKGLSKKFPDQIIFLILDNAGWHMTREENSKRRRKDKNKKVEFKNPEKLIIPSNVHITYLPPRTPEMNPIEVIWREIRKRGFKNILFHTLQDVVDKFNDIVANMSHQDVISITQWHWISKILNQVF